MVREDIRSIRTRKELREALMELLKEKTFDKITVNELAQTAMVSRITFYKHYKDKYDLLKDVMMYFTNAIYKYTVDVNSLTPSSEDMTEFCIAFIRKCFLDYCTNATLANSLFNSGDAMASSIIRNSVNAIISTLIDYISKDYVLKYSKEATNAFIVGAISEYILSHKDATAIDPEIFDKEFIPIIRDVAKQKIFFTGKKPGTFFN